VVRRPRQNKEQIGQAVEVGKKNRWDIFLGCQGDEPTLRAAAHRSGQVKPRPHFGPPRDDERF
jgi:hypothetical protein